MNFDYMTQGPKIAECEEKFAAYIGCKYAVAVSNGIAALHLSAIALEVKPGDKVLTTPITFDASANCVLYCGGEVDFVEQKGWKKGDLPVAENYYDKCLSLPMYQTLTNEEQKFVITCINNFYNNK